MDTGIASVLQAAKSESTTPTDSALAAASFSVPTVEEYIQMSTEELQSAPSSAPSSPGRKRGRPKGSMRPKSPRDEISGEERTRAYMTKLGQSQAEDVHGIYLRKKIAKIFDYFPHRLSRYYPRTPDVAYMSLQQLIDMDKLLLSILDEGDELVYVKEAFKWVAGVIENTGPYVHSRFLRWMPGADILHHQQGLTQAVTTLVDEDGDEGLGDETKRIAIDFIGWAPQNPYMNAALKLYKVMNVVKQVSYETTANPSDNPIANI